MNFLPFENAEGKVAEVVAAKEDIDLEDECDREHE